MRSHPHSADTLGESDYAACMLMLTGFDTGNPFTSVPADLNVGGNKFNFGRLLRFQESKAHALETAGEACPECPPPLSYAQIALSFGSTLDPSARLQAKVLLLHFPALKSFGQMWTLAVIVA